MAIKNIKTFDYLNVDNKPGENHNWRSHSAWKQICNNCEESAWQNVITEVSYDETNEDVISDITDMIVECYSCKKISFLRATYDMVKLRNNEDDDLVLNKYPGTAVEIERDLLIDEINKYRGL